MSDPFDLDALEKLIANAPQWNGAAFCRVFGDEGAIAAEILIAAPVLLARVKEAEKERDEARDDICVARAERDAFRSAASERDAARAEVERLREALEEIDAAAGAIKAEHSGWYDTGKDAHGVMGRIESSAFSIHTIARRALAEEKKT
jgi:endonuclease/exonuclease/phosphatase (EEP) superfamily protein YafD